MKNMVVLIDTNIILDVLQKREPFYKASDAVLMHCATKKAKGYIALHSVSNIFFILRRHCTADERRKLLIGILDILQVANADRKSVRRALRRNDFTDFEDCLQDECAKQINADYIITRNTNDFSTSEISAITPTDFLKLLKET